MWDCIIPLLGLQARPISGSPTDAYWPDPTAHNKTWKILENVVWRGAASHTAMLHFDIKFVRSRKLGCHGTAKLGLQECIYAAVLVFEGGLWSCALRVCTPLIRLTFGFYVLCEVNTYLHKIITFVCGLFIMFSLYASSADSIHGIWQNGYMFVIVWWAVIYDVSSCSVQYDSWTHTGMLLGQSLASHLATHARWWLLQGAYAYIGSPTILNVQILSKHTTHTWQVCKRHI